MPNFNSPIESVSQLKCLVWQLNCTDTPYGSLGTSDDDYDEDSIGSESEDATDETDEDSEDGTASDEDNEGAIQHYWNAIEGFEFEDETDETDEDYWLSLASYESYDDNEDAIGFVPASDEDNEDGTASDDDNEEAIQHYWNAIEGFESEDATDDDSVWWNSLPSDDDIVAASEEPIKGLEKVRVKNESGFDMECPICWEELEVDSEATRLPCSHLFHGDCILKWLNTSKFCPLCRFKLPS